jgi:hypothetical protein
MTTNKQTLENIEGLLRDIALHMGVTPGDASAPESSPDDPLDEVLEGILFRGWFLHPQY